VIINDHLTIQKRFLRKNSASYAYTNSTCHIYKIDDDNTYTLILTGAAEWFFLLGKQTINAAFKNCPIQKYQSIDQLVCT